MSHPILLFDRTAILSTDAHFWTEASRLGQCMVPRAIADELKQLARSTPDSRYADGRDDEVARAFLQFLPQSGWQTTAAMKTHPDLHAAPSQEVSRGARMDLAIAQAAFGVADLNPNTLVVLVVDRQAVLQRVNGLALPNLRAVTAMGVRQWARTHRPPGSLETAIAALKAEMRSPAPLPPRLGTIPARPSVTSASPSPLAKRLAWQQAIGNTLGFAVAVIGLLYLWRAASPPSFARFWQMTGLPDLPALPFEPSHPGAK